MSKEVDREEYEMWNDIAEGLMKNVLKDEVVKTFNDRVRIDAEINEKDGCFAAAIRLMCQESDCPDFDHDGCEIMKSAFIFETEREALEYAMEMKRHRRQQLLDSLK